MPSNPLEGCVPGVLSASQLKDLGAAGFITDLDPSLLDHSSFDLTVTDEVYHLDCGSVKPYKDYDDLLKDLRLEGHCRAVQIEDGAFTLIARETYIFGVKQQLGRPLSDLNIHGQATARSSVGRMDVLARLIVDGMDCYESFTSTGIGKGRGSMYRKMFLEVTPLTFSVRIRPGTPLSQLRLFLGEPESSEIRVKDLYPAVFAKGIEGDGFLRVDLTNTTVGVDEGCAFKAEKAAKPVCLWKTTGDSPSISSPNPREYWELLRSRNLGEKPCLTIEPESFYILRSQEKIALPASVAVYCRAIDETIGEMRIHYAGFVHPLFGRERDDNQTGTPLIFEVRGHDVKVLLTHGEKLARLTFYRMAKDAEAKTQSHFPAVKNPYRKQTLQLSNFFAKWQ